ncbi:hypothetical protein NI385_26230 (plasmid) [Vibrio parahaemolyticus]|nr:hypothetical protein NI385_26230 [Vibrio parahaemolyticus]
MAKNNKSKTKAAKKFGNPLKQKAFDQAKSPKPKADQALVAQSPVDPMLQFQQAHQNQLNLANQYSIDYKKKCMSNVISRSVCHITDIDSEVEVIRTTKLAHFRSSLNGEYKSVESELETVVFFFKHYDGSLGYVTFINIGTDVFVMSEYEGYVDQLSPMTVREMTQKAKSVCDCESFDTNAAINAAIEQGYSIKQNSEYNIVIEKEDREIAFMFDYSYDTTANPKSLQLFLQNNK